MLGANLNGADITEVNMQSTNLRGAQLRGAFLYRADLRAADLRRASLIGPYVNNANFSLTRVEYADLKWVAAFGVKNRNPFKGADDRRQTRIMDQWLKQIPEGRQRDPARLRFGELSETVKLSDEWPLWQGASRLLPAKQWDRAASHELADYLGELACEPRAPPYVAQGIARRIESEFRWGKPWNRNLVFIAKIASRLLSTDCEGAEGLSEEELDVARKIVAANSE